MKHIKHIVKEIKKDSIAEEVGIEVGDELLYINSSTIEDILDYHLLVTNEYIEITIVKKDSKEEWIIEIEKDEEEELGIVFENEFMDDYRSCTNNCIFCFIDQLPKGMRDTLYFKDDDARLSFLQGNYITLTNMKEKDLNRIIKYHLSPINISVQTMNTDLRKKMLNNRFADRIIPYMERLYEAGITMNGQIVLCKDVNDKDELDYSIKCLTKYIPHMQSVSVVPVGLSKYRDNLYPLQPFTKEDAKDVLSIIHKWQNIIYKEHNTHFIHAGDEFYFLAGEDVPDEDNYDGYLQYENGVGMTRLLIDEFDMCYNKMSNGNKLGEVSIVTGTLMAPMIENFINKINIKYPNLIINLYPIINNYFGERITVSGLLTGTDIIDQLKNKTLGDKLLLPSNLLRNGQQVLLDDITVEQIEEQLNIKIQIVNNTGEDFINAIIR
jgi:putative radical SAM enzyme (TIGR03279 family)